MYEDVQGQCGGLVALGPVVPGQAQKELEEDTVGDAEDEGSVEGEGYHSVQEDEDVQVEGVEASG